MNFKEEAAALQPYIVEQRRWLHQHPELTFREKNTTEHIENELKKMGIPTTRFPDFYGVMGTITGSRPGKTVLLRADIDALGLAEENDLAFCSQNKGVMHACGHDGHMAMLLTEAKILAEHKEEWEGKIILMFEEAEEMGERGIAPLLRYLRDNRIHVDACFGTHVKWDLSAGKVGILYGSVMAGAYFFRVKIHGKSGHGSRPDMAHSPIECFVTIANELRAYRMRAVAPEENLTYSFGCVEGGHEPNIIPEELTFAGTARCTKNEDGLSFRTVMKEIIEHTCRMYECTAEFVEDQYFPVTVNTRECVDLARKAVRENCGTEALDPNCPMWMATETFSITESIYPGVFFFTGIYDETAGSGSGHHTPAFDIGEKGLVTGVAAALSFVLAALKEKPKCNSFQPADLESMLKLIE